MNGNRYDEGNEPAIRDGAEPGRGVEGQRCPFCGEESLLLSSGDHPTDRFRIELYCDNSMCDAREMTVIALRMNDSVASHRADVRALVRIDGGTESEQEAEGYELTRDEAGKIVGRLISFGNMQQGDREAITMGRRQRPTEIEIRPESDV